MLYGMAWLFCCLVFVCVGVPNVCVLIVMHCLMLYGVCFLNFCACGWLCVFWANVCVLCL